MSQTYDLAQLDEVTTGYLRKARDTRATGLPGAILEGSNGNPLWIFLLGLMVLIITLILTFPSSEDPHKTAMLQTAGFLLGGWTTIYAFRVWRAQGRNQNLGRFWYADPHYLWMCSGWKVTILAQGSIKLAKTQSISDQSKLSKVVVQTLAGNYTFVASDSLMASYFVDFLNVLHELKVRYPDAANMSPAQLGHNAQIIAGKGRYPEFLDRGSGGLLNSLPHPQVGNSSSSGIVPLLIILAVGCLCYFGLPKINEPLRDESTYAHALSQKDHDLHPMRNYLADERNKLHREDAEKALSEAFDKQIAAIQQKEGVDPLRADAFCKILDKIRSDRKLGLYIYLNEIKNDQLKGEDFQEINVGDRKDRAVKRVSRKVLSVLQPGLVRFLALTSEEDRANLVITWKLLNPRPNNVYDIQWSYTLKAPQSSSESQSPVEPEKPFFTKTQIFQNKSVAGVENLLNLILDDLLHKTFGSVIEIMDLPNLEEDNN